MAYGRCCSKLLLVLCGRFLVRPGIFPGFASKQQLRLRMGAGSVCARACAHLMCRCVCKYVCMHMRMCICMRACMHLHMVQKWTTLISLTHHPWGGPYPSLKMASVWSSLCSFSVRNRTGGKPRFDAQMWGGPYPSLKMVSLWSSMCSFSVRNRPEGKLRESADV